MAATILHNVDLYKYNTMRLHSNCKTMYVPHDVTDLIEILKSLKELGKQFHILSAGSNIIFAEHVVTPIINLMELDSTIDYSLGENQVKVGCSVRIQKLIKSNENFGIGGIEYLYSIPSSVGGAIYMNAGRGKSIGVSISDYILEVEYLDIDELKIKTLKGTEGYSYRHSPFQEMYAIILKVSFKFREQSAKETERLIKERLDYSKKFLSADKPSCGSVFISYNPIIIRLIRGMKCGGAMFSKKTSNWISNIDNATASDILHLVNKAKKIHSLLGFKCIPEIKFYN